MKKILLIILVLGVLGGATFAFVWYAKRGTLTAPQSLSIDDILSDDAANIQEEVVPPEIKKVDESNNIYIHKKYGFTFNYPSDMKTSNFREGDGESINFQGDNGDWFQIYITSWDEEGDITVERIRQDLPDISIKEPQKVILGPRQKEGVGPHALIFFSKDSGLGETREVWFVQNRNFYQITTYKRLDSMIGEVLSTLVFN